jgi:hypothetical protein
VEATFGIDPMLMSLGGASFDATRRAAPANNRIHFSARCAKRVDPLYGLAGGVEGVSVEKPATEHI